MVAMTWQSVDADEVDQRQDRFANTPQNQRASDRDLDGERKVACPVTAAQLDHLPEDPDRTGG